MKEWSSEELAEQIGNFHEVTRAGIWRAEALEAQGEREAVCAHADELDVGAYLEDEVAGEDVGVGDRRVNLLR